MARYRSRHVVFTTLSLSVITIFSLLFWLNNSSFSGTRVSPIDLSKDLKGGPAFQPPPPPAGASLGPGSSSSSSSAQQPLPSSPSSLVPPPPPPPPPSSAMGPPTAKLEQGSYVGNVLPESDGLPKTVEVFRGIPFAQSTAGENRFRPPVRLPASSETFTAAAYGECCPNQYGGFPGLTAGENCLNLNLYRPAGTKKGHKRPVAIYVHGGAFNGGLGIERNMASFVGFAADDIIGVNFNYRVGALGFLPSALTAAEGILNLGLRDQQALFQWVQENVAEFGGDPGNVTIMGLSAGAHSIGHHLMYYEQGKAPFHRAVMESGATTARAVFLPTHPRHLVQFREFLIAAGVAGVPEADVIAKLRTLPESTILQASRTVWDKYSPSVCWPFQPVIDGLAYSNGTLIPNGQKDPILPDLPIRSWRKGHYLKIPIITGFNTNEGAVFIPQSAETDADFRAFFQTLIPSIAASDLDALSALYPDPATHPTSPYANNPPGVGTQWSRLDAAYGHYAYICPVLQTAHFASSSLPGHPVPPVWVYNFAAVSGARARANHGDNQQIVAHDPGELAGRPGLTRVSDSMHGAWARFVARGDPNPPSSSSSSSSSSPWWAPFSSPFTWSTASRLGQGQVMVFGQGNDERAGGRNEGVPAKPRALTESEMAQCRFWWDRVELSEGLGWRGLNETTRPLVAARL